MTNVIDLLDDLPDLRPFPAVATKVASAVENPDVGTSEVTDLISCEPSIAMRILRVANSPTYGFSREVRSINQAVVVLGSRAIRDLVLTVATADLFAAGSTAKAEREQLWNHSLACGAVAGVLAEITQVAAKDEAFLSGILHDVGKLLFFDLVPDDYAALETTCNSHSIIASEQEAFGVDHQDLGQRCCDEWGLPNEVHDAVCHHHAPEEAYTSPKLTSIISAANTLARAWGIGYAPMTAEDLSALPLGELGITEDQLESIQESALEEFNLFQEACAT